MVCQMLVRLCWTVILFAASSRICPVAGSTVFPHSEDTIPILALHQNTSDGYLAPPYVAGCTVTVSGVITVGSGVYSSDKTDVYIQDGTAGIRLYSDAAPIHFDEGDSVTITGALGQYRGMTEIHPDWYAVTVHRTGCDVPLPKDVTCSEAAGAFLPDFTEPDEGRLVSIRSVTFDLANSEITDSTGSVLLYIDGDSDITPPAGRFHVTGILKQYKPGWDDPGPPYTADYEIVPRHASDLFPAGGPRIVHGPDVTAWRPDGATIRWTTDGPAFSCVDFGHPDSTGFIGSVEVPDLATEHVITLSGLDAGTIYRYRVRSSDATGENASGDRLLVTRSDPSSSGAMRFFFSQPVDTTLAAPHAAQGEVDLATRFTGYVDSAAHSIDACFMKLTEWGVRDALIRAAGRGVRVRFICDNGYAGRSEIQALRDAGIPVISDDFGDNDGSAGLMHNKFAVSDFRDRSTATDDRVWTGSFNLTYYGSYPKPADNVAVIHDQALAAVYTREFEEMWGSDSDVPDPVASRFGIRKKDNIPHFVPVGGVMTHPTMSPSDGVIGRIVHAIGEADSSVHFSIYSFTRSEVSAAMQSRVDAVSGFRLRGVFDTDQRDGDGSYSQWPVMNSWTPAPDIHLDGEEGLLHHKVLIVDGDFSGSNPLVVTGSANWSTRAETANDENILIIRSSDAANQYLQEFSARYKTAGGTESITTAVRHTEIISASVAPVLHPAAPNPFNADVTIRFRAGARSSRLSIYDVRGRMVRRLAERVLTGRQNVRVWDGRDDDGLALPSGVYIIRLSGAGEFLSRKVALIR